MRTRTVVALVLGGVAISLACGLLPLWLFREWSERAAFGDMFAAGEAVASALALGGVIVAIVLQREELQLQRRELAETREVLDLQRQELQRSAEAQAESQRALRDQVQVMADSATISGMSLLIQAMDQDRKLAEDRMTSNLSKSRVSQPFILRRSQLLAALEERVGKYLATGANKPGGRQASGDSAGPQ